MHIVVFIISCLLYLGFVLVKTDVKKSFLNLILKMYCAMQNVCMISVSRGEYQNS
jgi:hypothetical protein